MTECEATSAEKQGFANGLLAWYSLLDEHAKSRLRSHLDHLPVNQRSHITQLSNMEALGLSSKQELAELGALQLAECIGSLGQRLYQMLLRIVLAKSPEHLRALEQVIARSSPKHLSTVTRYLIPFSIVANARGDDAETLEGVVATLFACWMAMMTPVDPRTLSLVQEYNLRWEDIHPGQRFYRIVGAMSNGKYWPSADFRQLRASVDKLHDRVAADLGWPDFDTLMTRMSVPHHSEKFFEGIYLGLDDPFRMIYEQINLKRKEMVWCDVFPGMEMVMDNPVVIPVSAVKGHLSVTSDSCGAAGFVSFVWTRVNDLLTFGNRNWMTDALMHDRWRSHFDTIYGKLFRHTLADLFLKQYERTKSR